MHKEHLSIVLFLQIFNVFDKLTNRVFGKYGLGGDTGISRSELILSHHPEFILAALH